MLYWMQNFVRILTKLIIFKYNFDKTMQVTLQNVDTVAVCASAEISAALHGGVEEAYAAQLGLSLIQPPA